MSARAFWSTILVLLLKGCRVFALLLIASQAHAIDKWMTDARYIFPGGIVDGGGQAINVVALNVRNDGTTDTYDALQTVVTKVNALCAAGQTPSVLFPPGTYLIDRYKIEGGASQNSITNLIWGPCNGLTLSGYGAKFELKGDFNRAQDDGTNSYSNSVTPFEIASGSQNVVIEGFEVDGNIGVMTRASNTLGNFGTAVLLRAVTDVTLRDLYVHHLLLDGIYVGGNSTTVAKNIRIERVRSVNNSRQGLSIIHARGVTVTDSEFSNTGVTGTYGSESPSCGIDIEPNRCKTTSTLCSSNNTLDDDTAAILIQRTRMENNVGCGLTTNLPYIHDVTLDRITVKDGGETTSSSPITLAVDGGVLINSTIECTVANCGVKTQSANNSVNARTRIANTVFRTAQRGLQITTDKQDTLVEGNFFIGTHTTSASTDMPFIQSGTNAWVRYVGNYHYFPAAAHDGTTSDQIARLETMLLASDNVWETDADAAFDALCTGSSTPFSCCSGAGAGSCETDLFFNPSYSATSRVNDEWFVSGVKFRATTGATTGALPYTTLLRATPPATQTISAGNTVTADACGGIKQISAAGSVTTDTTNTFTAPGVTNQGCVMVVCNTSANAITLDQNALFTTASGSDVTLTNADDCVLVGSNGSKWRQMAAVLAGS